VFCFCLWPQHNPPQNLESLCFWYHRKALDKVINVHVSHFVIFKSMEQKLLNLEWICHRQLIKILKIDFLTNQCPFIIYKYKYILYYIIFCTFISHGEMHEEFCILFGFSYKSYQNYFFTIGFCQKTWIFSFFSFFLGKLYSLKLWRWFHLGQSMSQVAH
jgi:hypothetical protein